MRQLVLVPVFFGICAVAAAVQAAEEKNALPAAVKAVLDKADKVELICLDPDPKKGAVADGYYGWRVIGKTVLKDEKSRKLVLDALYKGIAEGKEGAKCFDPGHGIRATAGGKTVDLVICFDCSWVYSFLDGKRVGTNTTTGGPFDLLEKVLKEGGITRGGK